MYFALPIRSYLSHSRYCCATADDDIRVRIITTLPVRSPRCVIESLQHQSDSNTQEQGVGTLLVPFEQPDIRRLLLPRWHIHQPNGHIKPTNQGSSGHQDPRTRSWGDGDRSCQCEARRPIDQYLNNAHAICPQPQAIHIKRDYCRVIASHFHSFFFASYWIIMIVYSRYWANWIFLDWYKQVNHEIRSPSPAEAVLAQP